MTYTQDTLMCIYGITRPMGQNSGKQASSFSFQVNGFRLWPPGSPFQEPTSGPSIPIVRVTMKAVPRSSTTGGYLMSAGTPIPTDTSEKKLQYKFYVRHPYSQPETRLFPCRHNACGSAISKRNGKAGFLNII